MIVYRLRDMIHSVWVKQSCPFADLFGGLVGTATIGFGRKDLALLEASSGIKTFVSQIPLFFSFSLSMREGLTKLKYCSQGH